jgi:5-methyltetrahydrofolate--homocysteine methyltransferase
VKQALDDGVGALTIVEEGLTKGMDIVGEKFEKQEFFLPDLLLASETVKQAMYILKPYLAAAPSRKKVKVVMGSVEGDIHDIGKNLVSNTLEVSGFTVIDLGVNVPPARFIEAAKEHNADLIGCSALISATMVNLEKLVQDFEKAGLRDQVKLMFGGAPLSEDYVKSIGGDFYGANVRDAVVIAKQVGGEK